MTCSAGTDAAQREKYYESECAVHLLLAADQKHEMSINRFYCVRVNRGSRIGPRAHAHTHVKLIHLIRSALRFGADHRLWHSTFVIPAKHRVYTIAVDAFSATAIKR